jgi:hypothetical protein
LRLEACEPLSGVREVDTLTDFDGQLLVVGLGGDGPKVRCARDEGRRQRDA